MKTFIWKHKVLWISIVMAALLIMFMGSCTGSKYGCYEPKDRGIIHKPLHRY
jgi:hypothetical protein